jgi:hypothetical protein
MIMTQEPWTPYNNRIKWGLLTEGERRMMREANGYPIQLISKYGSDREIINQAGVYLGDFHYAVYRIVKPAPTPSTVDWSQVGHDVVAFATDANGDHRAYTDAIPHLALGLRRWLLGSDMSSGYPAKIFPSFKSGSMDWKDSLIIRPGYEVQK